MNEKTVTAVKANEEIKWLAGEVAQHIGCTADMIIDFAMAVSDHREKYGADDSPMGEAVRFLYADH